MAVTKTSAGQAAAKAESAQSKVLKGESRTRALKLVEPEAFTKGHPGRVPSKGEVSDAAKVVRAQKELLRLVELRLIHQAARSRTSQDAVAALLGTSQPTISRLTKQIAQDPSILEPTPSEIIYMRAAGQIDTDPMLEALLSYTYEPSRYDPTGGDGFIRGAWRQIEDALTAGLITDEEYQRIGRKAPDVEDAVT